MDERCDGVAGPTDGRFDGLGMVSSVVKIISLHAHVMYFNLAPFVLFGHN